MQIKAEVSINAPKQDIWRVVTDLEHAPDVISAIEEVDILEKPADGLVGLKWKETRIMFGKTATEVMWVTDAVENEYYQTEARSHGSIYTSRVYITGQDNNATLGMEFGAQPQTFAAKILSATMGFLFKGATRKAVLQDLNDIKASVEANKPD